MIGAGIRLAMPLFTALFSARFTARFMAATGHRSRTSHHRWMVADDPLGPTTQQPETARDLACDLTASDSLCSPPTPDRPIDFDPPSVAAGGGAFGVFGTLLVVVLVVALVAIIGWIVVSLMRNRTPVDDVENDDVDEALDDIVGERIVDDERPPARWRRAAAEHRAAGRFRDAVRCEYRALVGDLARAGHVDEIPGRTSGEERQQIWALSPRVAPSFDQAADIFDEAWFDDGEVTAEHDERFRGVATVVLDDVFAGVATRRGRQ